MRKLIMVAVAIMLGVSLTACGDSHAGMHCERSHDVTVMVPIYHTWYTYTTITRRYKGRTTTSRVSHKHSTITGWLPVTHNHCDVWVANTPATTHS